MFTQKVTVLALAKSIYIYIYIYEVKKSHYRPRQALRVPKV
jgi:hypothetical protein